jgi:hypothetical protein
MNVYNTLAPVVLEPAPPSPKTISTLRHALHIA